MTTAIPKSIKLVVVGDGAVGKTCMLVSYANNKMPDKYEPTVFDNYVVLLSANSETIELSLWDTAGQEDFERLRPLSYSNADVFLLCFSVVEPVSLENVVSKWQPELNHFCPTTPIVLVGTKSDLRYDDATLARLRSQNTKPVTEDQAEAVANKIKAVDYVECSAMTGTNLKMTFDTAVRTVLLSKRYRKKKNTKCMVM